MPDICTFFWNIWQTGHITCCLTMDIIASFNGIIYAYNKYVCFLTMGLFCWRESKKSFRHWSRKEVDLKDFLRRCINIGVFYGLSYLIKTTCSREWSLESWRLYRCKHQAYKFPAKKEPSFSAWKFLKVFRSVCRSRLPVQSLPCSKDILICYWLFS